MSASDVRKRPDQGYRAGAPAFDFVVSKLRRPLPRPGTVRRAVLERLARDDLRPVASVAAPAGYGETTLLSQWAERDGRPVAWVSVDEKDSDPRVLLTYVAQALDQVEPVGQPGVRRAGLTRQLGRAAAGPPSSSRSYAPLTGN